MLPSLHERLSTVRPAERIELLVALFEQVSVAGNAALAQYFLAAVESSATALQIPEDCDSLWYSATVLADAGEAGRGWTLLQRSGCKVDKLKRPEYVGIRVESLARLGQREKALALLAAAEIEGWKGGYEEIALSWLGRAYLALQDYRRAEDLGKRLGEGLLVDTLVAQGRTHEALAVDEEWSESAAKVLVPALLRMHPRSEIGRLLRKHGGPSGSGFSVFYKELINLGDLAEAERLVRSELPLHREAWFADIAQHYARRGDRQNAERILVLLRQRAEQSYGDMELEPRLHLALCRILAALGRYREARLIAEKNLERLAIQTSILKAYASEQNPQVKDFYPTRSLYSLAPHREESEIIAFER